MILNRKIKIKKLIQKKVKLKTR